MYFFSNKHSDLALYGKTKYFQEFIKKIFFRFLNPQYKFNQVLLASEDSIQVQVLLRFSLKLQAFEASLYIKFNRTHTYHICNSICGLFKVHNKDCKVGVNTQHVHSKIRYRHEEWLEGVLCNFFSHKINQFFCRKNFKMNNLANFKNMKPQSFCFKLRSGSIL